MSRVEAPKYDGALATLVEHVQQYLYLPDPAPFVLVFATIVAHRLNGPLVWLMLVGSPSSGKTELLHTVMGVPKVHMTSTLTEAALLSGTAQKERTKRSTGGLLRKIGNDGILVAKDFTTILSMNRDQRSAVLAAFRELHDGRWVRHLGTDGGQEIPWEGRLGFLGAVTEAIDSHHAVIAALGDRFLYCRMEPIPGLMVARKVLDRAGNSEEVRSEIQDLVAFLVDCTDPQSQPEISDPDKEWLTTVANVAAQGRSAVERDSYKRDIIHIHSPESPGRLAGGLGQLFSALRVIGCSREEARRLVRKVAVDCIPSHRGRLLLLLGASSTALTVENMRKGKSVDYPKTAVYRALEDMACLRIVERAKVDDKEGWKLSSDFAASWKTM